VNETSSKIAETLRPQNIPIQDLLQYHGKLYEQKAQIREAQRLQEEEEMRHVKLNPVTAAIVRAKTAAAAYEFSDDGSVSDASSSLWDYEKRLLKPTGAIKKSVMLTVENHSFRPKINPKSAELMANQPMYDPNWKPPADFLSGSSDRASSNIETTLKMQHGSEGNPEPSTAADGMQSPGSGYFYLNGAATPGRFSLNSTSASLRENSSVDSATTKDVPRVYYRSQMWAAKKMKDNERERLKRSQEELKECSFQPNIRSKSAPRVGGGVVAQRATGNNSMATIVEKNAAWKKKRDDELERERRRKDEAALEECTFHPFISKGRPGVGPNSSISRTAQKSVERKRDSLGTSVRPAAKPLQPQENKILNTEGGDFDDYEQHGISSYVLAGGSFGLVDDISSAQTGRLTVDDISGPATEDTQSVLSVVPNQIAVTTTPTIGDDDHPYYAEDLFLNATYLTNMDDSEPPPPPPPKTPPPSIAQFKPNLSAVGSADGTPVPARQPLVLKVSDVVGTKLDQRLRAPNAKKVGLDPDERRHSIERKVANL